MSLSTKLLSMLLIRAAVNAYRKLKLSITISEYSTTQRSLCGKGKRYSTQHTIPQNLNLKNILTKPSHFQGFPAFSGALRVQIQTALLKTFFSLLSALLQSLVSLYFLPISTLYSCNSMNLQFSRTFPDKSDGFSNILFRFW